MCYLVDWCCSMWYDRIDRRQGVGKRLQAGSPECDHLMFYSGCSLVYVVTWPLTLTE